MTTVPHAPAVASYGVAPAVSRVFTYQAPAAIAAVAHTQHVTRTVSTTYGAPTVAYAAPTIAYAAPAVAYQAAPVVAYQAVPAVASYQTLHAAPAVATVAHSQAFGYGFGVSSFGYGSGHFGYGHGLSSYGLNYGYGLGGYSEYAALLRRRKCKFKGYSVVLVTLGFGLVLWSNGSFVSFSFAETPI